MMSVDPGSAHFAATNAASRISRRRSLHSSARTVLFSFAAAFFAVLLTQGQTAFSQDGKKIYVRTGQEAIVTGSIHLEGEAPRPLRIDVSMDADCSRINPDPLVDWVILSDGKLANVFVYVKQGTALDEYDFESPTAPVLLRHEKCFFAPHVLGIQTQQTLRILNSDSALHNTHALPRRGGNPEWNEIQRPGDPPITKRFTQPEMFIPIKDNQHPWEKAYVGVFAHPFFAISGRDGSFRIEGLPPGDYTIVAWHEKFGERTARITIAPYETKTLDFTFESKDDPNYSPK
jgi:hypothetical protein